jgi:hypothetical protein
MLSASSFSSIIPGQAPPWNEIQTLEWSWGPMGGHDTQWEFSILSMGSHLYSLCLLTHIHQMVRKNTYKIPELTRQ